jgi:hypothetical protein
MYYEFSGGCGSSPKVRIQEPLEKVQDIQDINERGSNAEPSPRRIAQFDKNSA